MTMSVIKTISSCFEFFSHSPTNKSIQCLTIKSIVTTFSSVDFRGTTIVVLTTTKIVIRKMFLETTYTTIFTTA